jgi:uncharacterized protein (DUF983 family)
MTVPFPYKPDKGSESCPKCGQGGLYVITMKYPLAFCESCGEYVKAKVEP